MSRGRAFAILLVVLCALASLASEARAESPEDTYREGIALLERGEHGGAIDRFEALADMGFVHPDASFARGLAYVARVRASADRPGDLGRAAAAFEETLHLRPSDDEADHALDLVRAEVVRRRARRGKDATTVRPTLDRVVVGLASERTWSLLALASSVLLSLGLFLRRSHAASLSVAGRILAPTALLLLLVFLPLTLAARELRRTTRAAVIVVPEVHLVDENGTALGGEPIPEAQTVEAGASRGALVHVRWGSIEGFIPSGSVRMLPP